LGSITERTLQRQQYWRRHLHQHPETGFEEISTSAYVAGVPTSLGLDVHRGIGGTGLVASLTLGTSRRAIGLRADMDALYIAECALGRAHSSRMPGKMHA
jgi:metal-dependent amidase/aminoacylase/carboxypeptidase family protein